jgi:Protein of unknown function (DUF3107)
MDVRIGVVHTPKELSIEVESDDPNEVVKALETALGGNEPVVWLTDKDGRRVGVPTDKVAYVEVDQHGSSKRVGFGGP